MSGCVYDRTVRRGPTKIGERFELTMISFHLPSKDGPAALSEQTSHMRGVWDSVV